MSRPFPQHPFLSDEFAPIQFEADAYDLPVRGEIPRDLFGTLLRNSPNPQFAPRDKNYHCFVGDGMVHAFHIEDGRVSYRNRWVRTPKFELERAAHRSLFGSWGDPRTTDRSAIGKDFGVANTSIVIHGNKAFACEEMHLPFEIDPETLESRGYWNFSGALKTGRFTAHPKVDPQTGEMVFFGYSVGGWFTKTIAYGFVDREGKLTRMEKFNAPYSCMIHDFLATKNYLLFPIMPLTGSLMRAMTGRSPFKWEPDKGSYVGVVRRDAGAASMRWFNCDPCFVFHGMNAYEEDDKIVAHVIQYDAAPELKADSTDLAKANGRLTRWELNLRDNNDHVKQVQIDDLAGEFPRIDERFAQNPYRHGYFAAKRDGIRFDKLVHHDFATGRQTIYKLPEGDALSEPVFAPRHAGAAEGDGYLLATIYRGSENRSDFAIFDASAIDKGPLALVELSHRVTTGFHGAWLSS